MATRDLIEAEAEYRNTGYVNQPQPSISIEALQMGGGIDPSPICFVSAANLKKEHDELLAEYELQPYAQSASIHPALPEEIEHIEPAMDAALDNLVHVISTERECDSFIEWRQGFSPKEHQEQEDRENDRLFQKQLLNQQLEAQERLVDNQLETQEEISKRQRRRSLWLQLLAGLIGVATATGVVFLTKWMSSAN
ncbi:MAG: hypothetical protein IIB17_00110 [Chloroflexi bacterium]|nr:hypothetical protein [Chloroflexota bacterium]